MNPEEMIERATAGIKRVHGGDTRSRRSAERHLESAIESVRNLPEGSRKSDAETSLASLLTFAFPYLGENASIVGSKDNAKAREAILFASTTMWWVERESVMLGKVLREDAEARRLLSVTARREADQLGFGSHLADHPFYSEKLKAHLRTTRRRLDSRPSVASAGLPGLGKRR